MYFRYNENMGGGGGQMFPNSRGVPRFDQISAHLDMAVANPESSTRFRSNDF